MAKNKRKKSRLAQRLHVMSEINRLIGEGLDQCDKQLKRVIRDVARVKSRYFDKSGNFVEKKAKRPNQKKLRVIRIKDREW
jgi:hypothetical protein